MKANLELIKHMPEGFLADQIDRQFFFDVRPPATHLLGYWYTLPRLLKENNLDRNSTAEQAPWRRREGHYNKNQNWHLQTNAVGRLHIK